MLHFGIDILLQQDPVWKKEAIGLVTNRAATTHTRQPSRKALLDAGFNIVSLFSPEHGLDATGADGQAIQDGLDPLTGLKIVSLYGERLAPSAEDLAGIDLLLFDIPDIGSRFYTYLWTMTHVMEAAARHNKPLIILDRPNPVSGNLSLAEGPMLDSVNASFIGRWPIPVRHSCTLGELALYFNARQQLNVTLEIIKCSGWERNLFQPDWGIPFIPTSPAIQSFESMLLYPGLCLLETTNISEGRGTPDSFTVAGAPWMKGYTVAGMLNEMGLEDVSVQPISFTPASGKYEGELCSGVQFRITEPAYFQSVANGLLLIKLIQSLYPGHFQWLPYPTHVNPSGRKHLDKLLGISNSEDLFPLSLTGFIAAVVKHTACPQWKEEIDGYLCY
ncbi:MAG: DUF1343 domain-containing protein [Sediminibacterium sp.]